MTDPLMEWWGHTVGVWRLTGSGPDGDVYTPALADDPTPVAGFYRDGAKLVFGPDGRQITANGQFAFARDIDRVPVGSRIKTPDWAGARITTVVASAIGDGGGQPTPDHHEISVL